MDTTHLNYETLALRENPDAAIVTSLQGEILHWSHGAERVFGYSSAEAVGRTINELIVPPNRLNEEDNLRAKALLTGAAAFESILRRKNGTLVYVDTTCKVVRTDALAAPVALWTKKDVTQLRVQRDAKLVEAKFRDLLESTPDGVVLVNASGHILFANTHAEDLFGYAPHELQGRPVDQPSEVWWIERSFRVAGTFAQRAGLRHMADQALPPGAPAGCQLCCVLGACTALGKRLKIEGPWHDP